MASCRVVHVATRVKRLASMIRQLLPSTEVVDVPWEESVGESSLRAVQDAEVLVADPPFISALLTQSPSHLQWVHCTWAGVEALMADARSKKVVPPFLVTRQGEGFGQVMGEYVVGHVIACERHFRQLYRDVEKKVWNFEFQKNIRPLTEVTIGILGLGQIGREIARLCKAMGMKVWALQRDSPSLAARSCPSVDVFKPVGELAALLAGCDYVCNVLPSTPDTSGLLAGNVLQHCKARKSVFINIGRGDVCGEESLVKALQEGWLGGAVLDVFTVEPLPADSPLWTLPSVTITPHVSGPSLPLQVAQTFVKNLKCYGQGEALAFQVNWEHGY